VPVMIRMLGIEGREKVVALCGCRFLRISKEIRRIFPKAKLTPDFSGDVGQGKRILIAVTISLPQTTFHDRSGLCLGGVGYNVEVCSKANDAKYSGKSKNS